MAGATEIQLHGSGASDPEVRLKLRTAFGRFATGVTIVTARAGDGEIVGMTANSFASVSLDPPLLLWSIAKAARSRGVFEMADHFAVHVLGQHQQPLAQRFAVAGADKFEGVPLKLGVMDLPLLAEATATFQCRRWAAHDAGDHVILLGEILSFHHTSEAPLVFHAGAYKCVTDAP
ncbi:MAG: flavin reductase family protein [Hyphomicrobiaceae bacterium]|jgi:3-hydroxy-9,10-secoandrosta-1,3,5(10)-triene-9,17-dione monooxygenase reductase component